MAVSLTSRLESNKEEEEVKPEVSEVCALHRTHVCPHLQGLGFEVGGWGFGVWGLGFGVWGFGVWDLGFGVRFRVQGDTVWSKSSVFRV